MFSNRKFWLTILCAWLVFVGIDFFFHASLLQPYWNSEVVGIKSESELFNLIPVGYGSFLILTILIGFVFSAVFKEVPSKSQAFGFGLVFAGLYSISNLFGLYSYVEIPLSHLVLFNAVYFIEIFSVVYIFYRSATSEKTRILLISSIVTFFGLAILGVVIQNLM